MAARADLLTYLVGQLHPLAAAARVPEADAPDGFGYALDTTLARFGPEAPGGDTTLSDGYRPAAQAVARYYALQTIQSRISVTDGALWQRVTAMMEAAAKEAAALGWPIGAPATAGFTRGNLFLDYRRPRRAVGEWG